MSNAEQLQTPSAEVIDQGLSYIGAQIQEYTHLQLEYWKQLPWLALQSQGNGGVNVFYRHIYEKGLYRVQGNAEGLFGIYIDCDNGNLLDQRGEVRYDQLATPEQIVRAWLSDREAFNGKKVLEHYQAMAVRPHFKFSFNTESEAREWRHQRARQLGLLSIYSRSERVQA